MSEFSKKYQTPKFNEAARRVKYELFEKITSANSFQIEREKSYDYLLILKYK